MKLVEKYGKETMLVAAERLFRVSQSMAVGKVTSKEEIAARTGCSDYVMVEDLLVWMSAVGLFTQTAPDDWIVPR